MGYSKRGGHGKKKKKKNSDEEAGGRNSCMIIHAAGVIHKRVRKLAKSTTIDSLPRDLLVDILARVSSSSFTDFINAKICCKDFLKAGEDEYVYERVTLDKFPVVHWRTPSDQMISFLTKCLEKGNPEALYRQGLKEYFNEVKVESGMNNLKRASEKGYAAATYVYSKILLSRGDELSSSQLALTSLKYSRARGVWKGRNLLKVKYESILGQMWINNPISI